MLSVNEVNRSRLVAVVPVLDTTLYAAGDTLFDRTLVSNAARNVDEAFELVSMEVLDKDDQAAAAMAFYFLSANVVFGVLNAAPSISDTDAEHLFGPVSFVAGDFIDVTGAKKASKSNIGLIMVPVSGTKDIYVAATTAGTPTQTASGIRLRLGFK